MNDSQQKVREEISLDFGAGSCTAACNHCLFGLDKKKSALTQSQLDLYRAIGAYSKEREAFLTFGLMDPFETFDGDLSFLTDATELRLSTRDPRAYWGDAAAKIVALMGKSVGVPLMIRLGVHSEGSVARHVNARALQAIFDLQLDVGSACEAAMSFSYRANRSDENLDDVYQSMRRAARRYKKLVEKAFPELETKFLHKKSNSHAYASARAMMEKVEFLSFEMRFISSTYSQKEVQETEEWIEQTGRFVVALFPQEVHANHSTMNINDKTLRFSYPEMSEIVAQAREEKVNATGLLFARIRERRERKRRTFAVAVA